jgi:4a-hydroxytetrahydrobiopterin dehydratase
MSGQGWKEFLAAYDLEDWVVLHGGPTAVFETKTLADAAALAQAIAYLSTLFFSVHIPFSGWKRA